MLNSEDLINKVKIYNKFLNPEKLNKAYDFAVKAHSNQKKSIWRSLFSPPYRSSKYSYGFEIR